MKINDETSMEPHLQEEIVEKLDDLNHTARSWQTRQLIIASLNGIAIALHALTDTIWTVETENGKYIFINEGRTECIKST